MQPPENPEGWLSQMAALIGIGGTAALAWLYRYIIGRKEADETAPARHVILEQAELADIGPLLRSMREIGPKLDGVLATDTGMRQLLEANHDLMKEMILIARRLDAAIQWMREEMRVSAALDQDRDRRDRARTDRDPP